MFTMTHMYNIKVINARDDSVKGLIFAVKKWLGLSLFPSHCKKQKQLKNLLSFAELQGATSGGFSGSCCQGYKKNQTLLISVDELQGLHRLRRC